VLKQFAVRLFRVNKEDGRNLMWREFRRLVRDISGDDVELSVPVDIPDSHAFGYAPGVNHALLERNFAYGATRNCSKNQGGHHEYERIGIWLMSPYCVKDTGVRPWTIDCKRIGAG